MRIRLGFAVVAMIMVIGMIGGRAAVASPMLQFAIDAPFAGGIDYDGGAAGTIHDNGGIGVSSVSAIFPGFTNIGITDGLFTFDGGTQSTSRLDNFGRRQWIFNDGPGEWEITGSLSGNPAEADRVIARGQIRLLNTRATNLTGPLGVADYGSASRPGVTLLGRA